MQLRKNGLTDCPAYCLNKLTIWGVYLIIILLPWQARQFISVGEISGSFWEYGSLSVFLIDILILLVFVLSLINGFNRQHFSRPLFIGWLVTIGYLIFNVLISINIYLSLIKLWVFIIALALVWIIITAKLSYHKIAWSLVVAGLWPGLLGIYQFIAQKVLASTPLGIASKSADILGVAVLETSAGRFLRAYGSLSHPNILGGLIVISIIATVYLYLRENNFKKKIFILISMIFLSAALFTTLSRSAVFSLMLSLLFWFLLTRYFKQQQTKRLMAAAIGLIAAVLLIMGGLMFDLVQNRIIPNNRLERISLEERTEDYTSFSGLVTASPFFGSGSNTYTYKLAIMDGLAKPAWAYQPLHNSFLLIILEFGFMGFALFCFLAGKLFIKLWSKLKKSFLTNSFIIALLFPFTIISLFDHYPLTSHFGILLGAVIISLSLKRIGFAK